MAKAAKKKTSLAREARIASARWSPEPPPGNADQVSGRWTFLTNHCHVLILLACNPAIVLREVAAMVGITERAVQRIIADLEEEGFIEREKVGRQNHYLIRRDRHLRHPVEAHRTIGELLRMIEKTSRTARDSFRSPVA